MRAPEFWDAPAGALAGVLAPLSAMWTGAAHFRRALARPSRAPVPVICVGNLVAGGAGKTPVVLSLAHWLRLRGVPAHVVTRGYGGTLRGPVRVDPTLHDAAAVGDEPLLIAAQAPCWVARDRAAGARAASDAGAPAILLDDGFQHPGLGKDISAVVVDAEYRFGNGRIIPAGPLREPIATGLARADAIVLIGDGDLAIPFDGPVLRADIAPIAGKRFAGRRVFAFAGIGRPPKFFATLKSCGAEIIGSRTFADHYRFGHAEIAALHREAQAANASLVTTAKDWVRLLPARRAGIDVLEIELRWRDEAGLERLLAPVLGRSDGERDLRAAAG